MPSTTATVIGTSHDLWQVTDIEQVCTKCGLADRCAKSAPTKFASVGADRPQIIFVLPELTDYDVACRYLSLDTPEMRCLNEAGQRVGLGPNWMTEIARFTVPVKCPGKPTTQNRTACRDLLLAEILHYQPKLVVALGKDALNPLIKGQHLPSRGRVVRFGEEMGLFSKARDGKSSSIHGMNNIRIMRLTHPGICLDDPGEFEFFYHDMRKIPRILAGTYVERTDLSTRNYQNCLTVEYTKKVLEYFSTQPSFSFDIEAGPDHYGLEPYAKNSRVLCIALADKHRNAYCIPLHHKDNPFLSRLGEIIPLLTQVLTRKDAEISAWNGKFDCRWLEQKYNILVNWTDDPMLMHGCLDENKNQNLKLWAEVDTDLGYYDDELLDFFRDEKGKPVAKDKRCYEKHVPLDTLMRYCCADADACEVLKWTYRQRLIDANLWTYYREHKMPDVIETAYTERQGIAIDTEHREATSKAVTARLQEITTALQNDPWLHHWRLVRASEYEAEGRIFLHLETVWSSYQAYLRGDTPLFSIKHQGDWENGASIQRLLEAKILRKSKQGYEVKASRVYTLDGDDGIQLNLNSPKQLQAFLYDKRFLNLKITQTTKKSGAPSTDKAALKEHEDSFPVLKNLLAHREVMKWKSTYLDPVCAGEYLDDSGEPQVGWIKDDGLCHPEYLLTGNDKGRDKASNARGTRTGRKSCVNPNVQNQKKRGEGAKEIYRYFISRWRKQGGEIVQGDFSQLELRIFAAIVGVKWMIQRYAEGADLHLELAMEVFQKTKEECLANGKALRAAAKELWFGPIYGEGWRAIKDVLAKKHKIFLTDDEAKALLKRLYDKMPEFGAFKQAVIAMLDKYGCVWTPFGRRRYLPHYFSRHEDVKAKAVRQAINFIIQSTGSDMTSWSWVLLNRWSRESGINSRIIISVHDSLAWDVYPGERALVVAATLRVMENLPFSFIRSWPVPVLTEFDYGEPGASWGDIDEKKRGEVESLIAPVLQLPQYQMAVGYSERMIA